MKSVAHEGSFSFIFMGGTTRDDFTAREQHDKVFSGDMVYL